MLGSSSVYKLSCSFLWLLRNCVMKCWRSAAHQMLMSSLYMKIGHVSRIFSVFVIFVYIFNLWPCNHQPIDKAVQHVIWRDVVLVHLHGTAFPGKLLCVQAAKWMKEDSMCSINSFLKCTSSFVMRKYSFPQPCSVDRLIFLTLCCLWVPDVVDSQKFYGDTFVIR